MEEVVLKIVKGYHTVRKFFRGFCSSRKLVYEHYRFFKSEQSEIPAGDMTVVPPKTILFDMFTKSWCDEIQIRQRVQYPGSVYKPVMLDEIPSVFLQKIELPWLWVGGVDEHGETHSVTDVLEPYVLPGNCIRVELLDTLSPVLIQKWKYLDPATLEEADFPAHGIVIVSHAPPQPERSTEEVS